MRKQSLQILLAVIFSLLDPEFALIFEAPLPRRQATRDTAPDPTWSSGSASPMLQFTHSGLEDPFPSVTNIVCYHRHPDFSLTAKRQDSIRKNRRVAICCRPIEGPDRRRHRRDQLLTR